MEPFLLISSQMAAVSIAWFSSSQDSQAWASANLNWRVVVVALDLELKVELGASLIGCGILRAVTRDLGMITINAVDDACHARD